MAGLWQDVRSAVRLLRRSPGYCAVTIAVLAIGLGVNAAIFTIGNALLLRPLSDVDPDRVVWLSEVTGERPYSATFSWIDYVEYRGRSDVFADLAATRLAQAVMVHGRSDQVLAETVSGNYFRALAVRTSLGRLLDERDDTPSAAPAVVIGHREWVRRFDSNPSAIGSSITIGGRAMTIVGVAPASFAGTFPGAPVAAWIPLAHSDHLMPPEWRRVDRPLLRLVGRLAVGVSRAPAAVMLEPTVRAVGERRRMGPRDIAVVLEEGTLLHGRERGAIGMAFVYLITLTSLVLVIASANLASLTLARTIARRREIAVRLALGAGRARVVRQMFVEALVLGGASGIAAGFLGVWASRTILAQKLVPAQLALNLDVDVRVAAFIAAATMVAIGVIAGVPAGRLAFGRLQPALKDASHVAIAGSRLQSALVVAQLAVSVVLLIAAGLLGRSLQRALDVDLGFNPAETVALDLDLPADRIDSGRAAALFDRIVARTQTLPGVVAVSVASRAPLDVSTRSLEIVVPGYEDRQDAAMRTATFYHVSEAYFDTVRLPLLSGRTFTAADRAGSARVAIVNEAFARRFWQRQDAIGRSFEVAVDRSKAWFRVQVVGVARDSKYVTLGEDLQPHVYLPIRQQEVTSAALLVRTAREDPQAIAAIQTALRAIDPNLHGFFPRTLREHVGVALLPARGGAAIAGTLATLATLLALIGLYALVAFIVAQRTRELALRMALGATPSNVRRLVLAHALRLAAAGTAIGLVLAAGAARFLRGGLHGISPTDPATFVAAPALLIAVALAACYAPARRATRLDPAVALKEM